MVWEYLFEVITSGKKSFQQTTCFNDNLEFINSKKSGVNSEFKRFFKRNLDLLATRNSKKLQSVLFPLFETLKSPDNIFNRLGKCDAYFATTKDVLHVLWDMYYPISIFFQRENGLFEITIRTINFVQSIMISHYHMMYICQDDII